MRMFDDERQHPRLWAAYAAAAAGAALLSHYWPWGFAGGVA